MKKKKKEIIAVDLFAGGGGTSSGLIKACKESGKTIDLTAINHWDLAIATHSANYPWAKHLCIEAQFADPRVIVPSKHLDILVASPSCVGHSRAAGGLPKNDQLRASIWDINRWLEYINVEALLVENVSELQDYGPLDKKNFPIKERKGELYRAWINSIKAFGYNVETKVLNAADYGAATSRSRLFILAKKGNTPIKWPQPTHNRDGIGGKKWTPAKTIIDWTIKSQSISERKRPLSPRTEARILEGLKRFASPVLQPFIIQMEHGGGIRSIHRTMPTITTARGGSMALVEPLIIEAEQPENSIPVTTGGKQVIQTFILSQGSGGAPRSTEKPTPTIPAGGAHALVQAALIQYHGKSGKKEAPNHRVYSVDKPIGALDTSNRYGLAEAFILPVRGYFGQNTPKSIERPIGSITQRGYGGLVEAQIDEEPVPDISPDSGVALVQPGMNGCRLDIKYRMLQPRELAAAMGFSRNYKFIGTKRDITKQIGNAVAVQMSYALCKTLLN